MENTQVQLPFTTSHAFLIGINAYEHLTPLSTAVNDAKVLAQTLAADHGYQVHPPLLNATQEEIIHLLEKELPQRVGAEDRILFYFAGHGIALDSDGDPQGYLVPADATPGNPESLVAMNDFHDALAELSCQHGLLILDCCFAGAFKWSTGFRDVVFDLPGVIYQERFFQYARDSAWQVITSSASDQKAVDILSDRTLGMRSDDPAAAHSPFAQALLDGIAGEADTIPKDRGDGVITATELYTYLRDRVEDRTTEQGKRQSPAMFSLQRHDKGQYIFLHPRHPLNLPPIPDRNPFMGLKSYDEADHGLFYGRDRVIAALLERVVQNPLTVVSGVSGTGKSSVIKAGLLPALRKQDWEILPIVRPGKQPMLRLQESVPNLTFSANEQKNKLLVIDQYEELLTQCLDLADRQAFEQQLSAWVQQHPQLRIVLSIRSDFEPQFENSPLAAWWQGGRYLVPSFNQDELREVIIKPTVQEVLFFEPDSLVDKLVDAVNQAPGALPLLSFTLSELYYAYLNSGRTNRAFTLEDYEQLGGVIGALRTRANTIYDEFDRPHQDSMRKLMLRMVSLEGGELASRRVIVSDLEFSDSAETQRLQAVAQQLVTARLIATGIDAQGQTYFEPAHDALIRAWGRLWEWIKAQGEGKMGLMYKLSLAVTDYQVHQTNEYLWNDDPRLEVLLADFRSNDHRFNASEETFLQKSDALRQRNKRRRWAIVVAVMVGLLSLSVFAFYERSLARTAQLKAEQKAREALSASTAAKARKVHQQNPTIGLNLALAAYKLFPSKESSGALHDILSDEVLFYQQHTLQQNSKIISADFSSDGQKLLTINGEGKAQLWSSSGKLLQRFTGHKRKIISVVFSPDDQIVLTGSEDGTARLWSLSGELLQLLDYGQEMKVFADFSPDGQTIITRNFHRQLRLWSINGEEQIRYPAYIKENTKVLFSPDNTSVLTQEDEQSIRLRTMDGTVLKEFSEDQLWLPDMVFAYNGSFLHMNSSPFSSSSRIKVWSASGEEISDFETGFRMLNNAVFSPLGDFILTWDANKLELFSSYGKILYDFPSYSGQAIVTAEFATDGRSFSVLDNTGQIQHWSLPFKNLQHFDRDAMMAHATFFPEKQRILTFHKGSKVFIWSEWGKTLLDSFTQKGVVQSAAFSKNGKLLLVGERSGSVILWNFPHESRDTFPKSEGAIKSVAFFPDGERILINNEFGELTAWSLHGKETPFLKNDTIAVHSFAFSPDGEMIITGNHHGNMHLWSLTGDLVKTFNAPNQHIDYLSFSPNGELVMSCRKRGGVIKVWSIEGELLFNITSHKEILVRPLFSPEGKTILVEGKEEGTHKYLLKMYDLRGDELQTFRTYASNLSFSKDGQQIVTTGGLDIQAWQNLYGQYLASTLWNRVYKLTPEEQAEYGIDWEY